MCISLKLTNKKLVGMIPKEKLNTHFIPIVIEVGTDIINYCIV